jgi:hypothetical protein
MKSFREQRSDEWNRKLEEEWEELWRPLLFTEGYLDEQKIKNEMLDLIFCYDQISNVYCELTGSQLSYATYYSDDIIRTIEDLHYDKECVQEDIKDMIKDCKDLNGLKKDLANYFDLEEKI